MVITVISIVYCYLLLLFVFQRLEEEIAHCKDQLQEIKARTSLVNKFVKKQTDVHYYLNQITCTCITYMYLCVQVRVQCNKRQNIIESDNIHEDKTTFIQRLEDEKRAHCEVENYLKKHIEVITAITIILMQMLNTCIFSNPLTLSIHIFVIAPNYYYWNNFHFLHSP